MSQCKNRSLKVIFLRIHNIYRFNFVFSRKFEGDCNTQVESAVWKVRLLKVFVIYEDIEKD